MPFNHIYPTTATGGSFHSAGHRFDACSTQPKRVVPSQSYYIALHQITQDHAVRATHLALNSLAAVCLATNINSLYDEYRSGARIVGWGHTPFSNLLTCNVQAALCSTARAVRPVGLTITAVGVKGRGRGGYKDRTYTLLKNTANG